MCGSNTTWIMATYRQAAGSLLQFGWMQAELNAESTVADCPAAACEQLQPPEWSCRQVTSSVGITMFKAPCYDQQQRVSDTDLKLWDVFQYYGPSSKQTSRCPSGTRQDLCFVRARRVLAGVTQEGWVPISRVHGTFSDSQCSHAGNADVFVRNYCGEHMNWWGLLPGTGMCQLCCLMLPDWLQH
jgi:hypothetical protein